MSRGSGYGQFCPVAKAAEIVTTRWTPLVLRELVSGSRRFNEIHRGVPLMSRALLSKRLRDLEASGIVERVTPDGARIAEYRLTKSGEELKPIIVALGIWGQRWVESALKSQDWDAGVLMWDIRRRIDTAAMPARRHVLQFEFEDAPAEMRVWWLVIDEAEVDLCQSDPGHDVDLYVSTDVPTMARVWIGQERLAEAVSSDRIMLTGDAALRKSVGDWLQLSVVVQAIGEAKQTAAMLR